MSLLASIENWPIHIWEGLHVRTYTRHK